MKNPFIKIVFSILLCLISGFKVEAVVRYVDLYSIGGPASDLNPGTISLPWLTLEKGFTDAQPGDTIYFREGIYSIGQEIIGLTIPISMAATSSNRIYFLGFPNEAVVMKGYVSKADTSLWNPVIGYPGIYFMDVSTKWTSNQINSMSQNGIPLVQMPARNQWGKPADLSGASQWAVDTITNLGNGINRIYVWSKDSLNPGNHSTELQEFNSTIYLNWNSDTMQQTNYITFKNLIIEGGYWPLAIATNGIEIIDCTIRNFDGSLKVLGAGLPPNDTWNSINGLIEGCHIYNYMRFAIDITGGDNWTIRNCHIEKGQYGLAHAILVKNNSINVLVEKNIIHDIDASNMPSSSAQNAGIWIGGASYGGMENEALNMIVKNNILYDLKGKHAFTFAGAIDCGMYNNLVYGCNLSESVVSMRYSNGSVPIGPNTNITIKNNVFDNNVVTTNLLYKQYVSGAITSCSFEADNNLYPTFYGAELCDNTYGSWGAIQAAGYDSNAVSSTATFVNAGIYNFRPTATSPVIDAGCDVPAFVTDDFDGYPRSTNDIGPFEYQNPAGSPENNELFDQGLEVYPNPANCEVILSLLSTHPNTLDILIYNYIGVLQFSSVWNMSKGSNKKLMNVSTLTPGWYFLKIERGGDSMVKKLIII